MTIKPCVMYVGLESRLMMEDPSIYDDTAQPCGTIVEGNFDNIPSLGVSVLVIYNTTSKEFEIYTEDKAERAVEQLKNADLVVGYNLRQFTYPVLSAYADYDLQRLPTFDLQAEIRFQRAKMLGIKLSKQSDQLPFISLTNIALRTLDLKLYTCKEMPRIWAEGKKDQVIDYAKNRVNAIKKIFEHGCRHNAIAYWEPHKTVQDYTILTTKSWAPKARAMFESVVPEISEVPLIKNVLFKPPPEEMLLGPDPMVHFDKKRQESRRIPLETGHVVKIDDIGDPEQLTLIQ